MIDAVYGSLVQNLVNVVIQLARTRQIVPKGLLDYDAAPAFGLIQFMSTDSLHYFGVVARLS